MQDPIREERKQRRKAYKVAERTRKLLIAAHRGLNSVKGRIQDPVWRALAQQLSIDPATSPEAASVLAEALAIHSIEKSARIKRRRLQAQTDQRQLDAWKAAQAADLTTKICAVREKKAQLGLDAWCLMLAQNPGLRALVGVTHRRAIKITTAENTVLKAKLKEVSARKYVYRTTLIKQGWTQELIDSVLGAPDKFVVNSHYPSGPKAMLYWVDRVDRAKAKP